MAVPEGGAGRVQIHRQHLLKCHSWAVYEA